MFTESEIAQLQFIARAQDLGFSLAEIKELAALKSENGRACPEVRGLIHRKLQNVRQKIAALKQLESELARGLRSCDGALKRPANTEQGCPVIQEIVTAPPYDPQHFVRVDETVTLTLNGLAPHTLATVSFDLCVLKSWDGNNPNYGPDRWTLSVRGGDRLLNTTFSNNPKTAAYDLSQQNYPIANSNYQTGAAAVNTLGYTSYGDSIYYLTFTFAHTGGTLLLDFSSSLFEGKGTGDESWGLDSVRVSINADGPDGAVGGGPGRGSCAAVWARFTALAWRRRLWRPAFRGPRGWAA